jgi:hypothetical protein
VQKIKIKNKLTIILIALSFSSFSQTWFDLGIKGGVGAGFLINNTVNSDSRFNVLPQMNNFVGGKVGVNFGDMFGIAFDVDYGTYNYGFSQLKIVGKDQNLTYDYKIKYNALNFMPAFRYTKDASYVEIGPQFSFTKNHTITDEGNSSSFSYAADAINTSLKGLVFGFGGHMIGNDVIALMMGLRFNYVFSNLTSYTYAETNFPFTNYSDITTPTKSSPINAQLVFELNYSLGYIVRASCGRRTAFIGF